MIDKEKVIKGLELCKQDAKLCFYETECPYQCEFPRCCLKLMDDALELLKEQEPLKPKSKVRHGENGQIQHFCRKCNAILFHHKQKFCINCGQAVKWG